MILGQELFAKGRGIPIDRLIALCREGCTGCKALLLTYFEFVLETLNNHCFNRWHALPVYRNSYMSPACGTIPQFRSIPSSKKTLYLGVDNPAASSSTQPGAESSDYAPKSATVYQPQLLQSSIRHQSLGGVLQYR